MIVMIRKFVSTVNASGKVRCLLEVVYKLNVAKTIDYGIDHDPFPGCDCESNSDCDPSDPSIHKEISLASKHKICKKCRCVPMGSVFCI